MLRLLVRPSAVASAGASRCHPESSSRAFSVLAGPPTGEEDLLQRSPLPTDHFQASLPRLSVPKLEDSLRRYVASQSALLAGDALAEHERVVKDFAKVHGPQLQESLQAFAKRNSHTSYITDFWFDMYLRDRRPVVFTHNPFITLVRHPTPAYNAVPVRATNMIYSSLRFLRALREGCLAPEVYHLNAAKSDTEKFLRTVSWCPNRVATYVAYMFKAYPLDMSQFVNLFASTRLPRPDRDEIRAWPDVKHLVVMRGGHFYTFDVLDESGRALSPVQILANLRYILAQPSEEAAHPLGALTSADRDTWTKHRVRLEELGNAETLEQIDSALFVLSLDDADLSNDLEQQNRSFLYGLTPNRWFDKSLSLMMDSSGDAGVSFEHSWGDGVAVMRYMNEMVANSNEEPVVHPNTEVPAGVQADVRRLEFELDGGLQAAIREARERHDRKAATLAIDTRELTTFGRADVKKARLSPDSVMQLVFQLAFHRIHGRGAPTYESCSTSAFKHGRTETLRSGTPETLAFCEMVASGSAGAADLMEAMVRCSKKHNQLTKEAAMGQGWDRHLFALRKMAEAEMPGAVVPLFLDPAYARINHIVLSTSTLSTPIAKLGGFAAVVPDGYGIGYGILDRGLGCIVTAYPEVGGTSLTDFLTAFTEAANVLKAVMDGRAPGN